MKILQNFFGWGSGIRTCVDFRGPISEIDTLKNTGNFVTLTAHSSFLIFVLKKLLNLVMHPENWAKNCKKMLEMLVFMI